MKPAQIRVFDGLRLTTEHLEHLQQSMISGVQDLREIAGLGRVYRGLDVTLVNDTTIMVQPGLAFDQQRNRVVIDEPQTASVSFGPNDTHQYVCVKSESIEQGQVEEHFTLVWDSGTVVIRPALPDPKENLLAIAEIGRRPDGSLAVSPLNGGPSSPCATPSPQATTAASPPPPSTSSGAGAAVPAPNPTSSAAAGAAQQPGTPEAGRGPDTKTTAAAAPTDTAMQSIVILASEPQGVDLAGRVLAMQKGGVLAKDAGATQSRYSLFEQELDVAVAQGALRCYVAFSMSVSSKNVASATPTPAVPPPSPSTPPASAAAPPPTAPTGVASSTLVRTLSVTSQGEALIAGGKAVSQLGLSTVQYGGREPAAAQWSSELSQDGIAGAALAALFSDVNQSEPARLIAENIRLVLRIEPSPPGKCHLIGELIWLNAPASRPIDDLANRVINLTWTAKVGWSTSNAT